MSRTAEWLDLSFVAEPASQVLARPSYQRRMRGRLVDPGAFSRYAAVGLRPAVAPLP